MCSIVFEVYKPNDMGGMITESPECIPYENLDKMYQAGYRFKLNGRAVGKNDIKNKVNAVLHTGTNVSSNSHKVSKCFILCVDNGVEYPTQSAAARDLGIDPAQVSDSIKTGRPRSGYTFKKVFEE
jgi:hypothetical protein